MQRLFSTFAAGWPGVGLLLLRLLTSVMPLHYGVARLLEGSSSQIVILQIISIVTSALILIGFWTPLAGTLATIVNLWLALMRYSSHSGDPWMAVIEGTLGSVLAMIGPGAWSLDARLFGRKHIDLPDDE